MSMFPPEVVETGTNRFRIDHDAGKHDDRTIALSLGVYAHQTRRRPHMLSYEEGRALAWTNQHFATASPWSF